MELDYLGALRYGVDYETRCLGKWNIEEENKMDIPGKLREDLKRIYGANDPLNYIEDVRVDTGDPRVSEEMLVVKLRVPDRFCKYLKSTGFNRAPYQDLLDALVHSLGYASVQDYRAGVQKAPEKEPPKPIKPEEKKLDPMDALKPERIIYSGPKTIVFWPDGTKTMVSLMEGQEHDEYTAYCAAVVKKMFGATHKAKKFLESVAVRPEPKQKKVKEAQMAMEELEVEFVGEDTARTVHVKPWETMETMTMPGTEDPDWGKKHWGAQVVEEGPDNGD